MPYTISIEQDEDNIYIATVKEFPGCHTQGKTRKEVLERIQEAIELYEEVDKMTESS